MRIPHSPDSKMWQVGAEWSGSFFQMRQFPRLFHYSLDGLWCYPALVVIDGAAYWLHLMFGTAETEVSHRLKLFPPSCTVITPVGSTYMLRYNDLHLRADLPWSMDAARSIGTYPWKGINSMTLREYALAEAGLLTLYEEAALDFAAAGTLSPAFRAAYERLTHPAFLEFLAFFSPDFVRALGR